MAKGSKRKKMDDTSVNFPETLAAAVGGGAAPTTVHVAGWKTCPSFVKAGEVLAAMKMLYPGLVDYESHPFENRDAFREWLAATKGQFEEHFGSESKGPTHTSSPFVWSSNPTAFIGGCEELLTYLRAGVAEGKLGGNPAAKEDKGKKVSTPEAGPPETTSLETVSLETMSMETVPLEAMSMETVPLETVPMETMPMETMPMETMPMETMPMETMPMETMPMETMPMETMPMESMPMESMPMESMPMESMPMESIPTETVSLDAAPAPSEAPASVGEKSYDYDLVVIGGGSGGLACSKEAASFGKKVCVLDYVKPSPLGTTWGLGGTCVNVGCIPKKLMHQSSLIGEIMHRDSNFFGWNFAPSAEGGAPAPPTFDWKQLVANVSAYIKSINFKYKVELRSKYVKYENFLGTFVDPHTLELWHHRKGTKQITTQDVVIAVGGRPRQLKIPGGDLAISSDDIFWMKKKAPGKTLVVGASYVALECAGFLRGMGYQVKVMVRSVLLRGFDQDMASKIGEFMEVESGVEFIRETVPESITKLENEQLLVKWTTADGESCEETFDTVLNATGRDPDVSKLGLDKVGVKLNEKTGRIWQKHEQTSTPNIFAIGDVIDAPELTPVAIQAGRLLSRRLYNSSTVQMDYDKVCTAVFTPIEYGCCGLSEEDSKERFGEDNIEIYHKNFTPLEWSLSEETRPSAESCYVKVICDKTRDQFVVGFHYLGPNAGEVTQAMGLAMKLGFTYDQMVDVVGIHPTTAEAFTTLEVTKSSGDTTTGGGC